MEARRPLHYHRNSVIVPKLGAKSRHKFFERPADDRIKVPQNTDSKICSTMVCPRCNAPQDKYRATCRKCRCCFYCGLVGGGVFLCQICGNHIPEEDREIKETETIRIA